MVVSTPLVPRPDKVRRHPQEFASSIQERHVDMFQIRFSVQRFKRDMRFNDFLDMILSYSHDWHTGEKDGAGQFFSVREGVSG
jgi:hypothetical protein